MGFPLLEWHGALITVLFITQGVYGRIDVCIRVPDKTGECLMSSEYHPVPKASVTQACLQQLLWYYSSPQNLTADEEIYFQSVSRRFTDSPRTPPSGFRQRKEYRQLTDTEREQLHRAFQILYNEGTFHRYGKLYGRGYEEVRNSPAFLGFQRVFLTAFEEELRRIDKTVSLPYWDYTIDTQMDNPVNSLLWSAKFFGNGNGRVVIGDFRDWRSPNGPIRRRYGESNYGQLMNRDAVKAIVTKCHNKDISYPIKEDSEEEYAIEYHHNGVLNWLGGSAADAMTAAYDPVFYFLSACTDYIWEVFRKLEVSSCNVNPAKDYPADYVPEKHGAYHAMFGFTELFNAHGYSNYWTTYWYNYSRALGCPDCESEYIWCDSRSYRCTSHSRRTDFNVGAYPAQRTEPFEPTAEFVPHRKTLPFMPSPLNDGRTMASAKRDAKKVIEYHQRSVAINERDQLIALGALGHSDLSDS